MPGHHIARRRIAAAIVVLSLPALVLACGGGGDDEPVPASVAGDGEFAPRNFGPPGRGANQWLPLKPGTQWVREGQVNVGHRRVSHRVVSTVTDVSKVVGGVRTVGVLDQDFNGGQIAEQSVDWFAEDKQGNIWDLGSYTESYEGGQFVNASDARLAGSDGEDAEIVMLANPRPGDEWFEAVAVKTRQRKCVPFNCYTDVLVIEEGGSEVKYWAPGVGQIKTEPQSGDKQEVEALVNLTRLGPQALAAISAEVLKLDRHARAEAADVFGRAPPAKRTL
ncbi:MAG TPA: hypothetical protein VN213_05825 [Solirubrobacteraceae bacterium]|nr:hypothetical protein [Solirubrobacteraceae bacterium]